MRIIFYDRVYEEGESMLEFAGLESIVFGDNRMIGVKRVDEIREDRIVLANVHGLSLSPGKGRPTVNVFGVPVGVTTRFYRCYVIAEESKPS